MAVSTRARGTSNDARLRAAADDYNVALAVARADRAAPGPAPTNARAPADAPDPADAGIIACATSDATANRDIIADATAADDDACAGHSRADVSVDSDKTTSGSA